MVYLAAGPWHLIPLPAHSKAGQGSLYESIRVVSDKDVA